MKRTMIIVMVICMLAASFSAFAGDGIWVGPTALYNYPTTLNNLIDNYDTIDVDIKDFSLGVEGRLDIGLFQASVNAIYQDQTFERFFANVINVGSTIEAAVNAGIYADLGLVGLGLTAGPTYRIYLDDEAQYYLGDEPVGTGFNVKTSADIILDETIFSAYFMGYTYDLEAFASNPDFGNMWGQAGVSVLFQL